MSSRDSSEVFEVRRARHRAFTLVELLVVLGIISVLVAFLFPIIRKARRQADATICLTNLRHIGTALLLYVDHENHGKFPAINGGPSGVTWVIGREVTDVRWPDVETNLALPETVRLFGYPTPTRLLICPTDPLKRWTWYTNPFSYAMNRRLHYSFNAYGPVKLTTVRNPSQKIAVIDQAAPWGMDVAVWDPEWGITPGPPFATRLSVRHQRASEDVTNRRAGWGNCLFVDGHCDLFPRDLSAEPRHYDPDTP